MTCSTKLGGCLVPDIELPLGGPRSQYIGVVEDELQPAKQIHFMTKFFLYGNINFVKMNEIKHKHI